MTLKFYMTPGSCSTGIHIPLEELELPFEVTIVNLPAGDHLKGEYVALNPKGTVPTLVLDGGQALTEFQAIAYWLARSYPLQRLLPDDTLLAAQALELKDDVAGTVHDYQRVLREESYR